MARKCQILPHYRETEHAKARMEFWRYSENAGSHLVGFGPKWLATGLCVARVFSVNPRATQVHVFRLGELAAVITRSPAGDVTWLTARRR